MTERMTFTVVYQGRPRRLCRFSGTGRVRSVAADPGHEHLGKKCHNPMFVFPAPFGPRKRVILPGSTLKDRLSTASVPPYRLVRPRASIMVLPFPPHAVTCWAARSSLGHRWPSAPRPAV